MTKTKAFFICSLTPIFFGSLVWIALLPGQEKTIAAMGIDFDVLIAILIFIFSFSLFFPAILIKKEFRKEGFYGAIACYLFMVFSYFILF